MLASPEGTTRFRVRHADCAAGHWRALHGLTVSSIGLGSYLGADTDAADVGYAAATRRALELGCNVLDSAINYRMQRSERALGRGLREAIDAGVVQRDEVVVCTKGGYIPVRDDGELAREYLQTGLLAPADIVAGCHAMTPRYLRDQLGRSLRNLQLDAVDVYYVHNPEQALSDLSREDFDTRMLAAFRMLEEECAQGRVGMYGVATWNGLRVPPSDDEHLSLQRLVALAREAAGGEEHHFGVVQAPLNLGMLESFSTATQESQGSRVPLLDAAARLGVGVMCSASILQGRLSRNLPRFVEGVLGLDSDARRALQFTRSCQGVTTALVGMGRPEHAEHNLGLARVEPASGDDVRMLFEAAGRAR